MLCGLKRDHCIKNLLVITIILSDGTRISRFFSETAYFFTQIRVDGTVIQDQVPFTDLLRTTKRFL